MVYTINIATKPYLKNFITTLYGDPIPIANNNHIGVFLIGCLCKTKLHVHLKPGEKGRIYEFLTEEVTCVSPISLLKDYGHMIDINQAIQINRYFDSIFKEHLYFWVQNRITPNKRSCGYKSAIESFMDRYNLHHSTNYDCLQKIEYRFRKNISKKMFEGLSTHKKPVSTLF